MVDYTIPNEGTVTGAAGTDRLTYTIDSAGGVVLAGMTGSLATGYSGVFDGPDTLDGTFSGIENISYIDNAGGDDSIATLGGEDSIRAGGGNDTVSTGGGNDSIQGGDGNDDLSGGSGNDNLDGGIGSDGLFGGAGFDALYSNLDGIDILDGGDDFDTLFLVNGGTQAITMNSSAISSGAGTIFYSGIESFIMNGSTVADILTTGANGDWVNAKDGDDSVRGGGGNDNLLGDIGNDTVLGDGGDDKIYGGNGNDSLVGGSGLNEIYGGDGNDLILGGNGAVKLEGGDGDDTINGGTGFFELEGGDGLDMLVVDFSARTGGVFLDMGNKFIYQPSNRGYIKDMEGVEVTSGSGSDKIKTNAEFAMDDIVRTGGGNDFVTINLKGDDLVAAGAGEDRLTLNATDAVNGVTFSMTTATASGFSGTASDTVNSVEVSGINSLTFKGLGGNDSIASADGADRLTGAGGDDFLAAGRGSDRLYGDAGNDTIVGGTGNDFLHGGTGIDVFTFNKNGNSGIDRIYDFEDGIDLIRIVEGSMAGIQSKVTVNDDDTRITFTNGSVLTLENVDKADITLADFLFV
jgi:Ca2+-binding RTX toxin-like protein